MSTAKHLVVAGIALLGRCAIAFALNVSGTVTDSLGTPLPGVKVEIWDDNSPSWSTHMADVVTDANGAYVYTGASAGDDPFVKVKWEWFLNSAYTAGAPNYDDHVIRLVDSNDGGVTYTAITSATSWDITGNVTINVAMSQPCPANMIELQSRIVQTLDFVRTNKGATENWTFHHDIEVHLTTLANPNPMYESGGNLWILPESFVPGGDTWWGIALHHEMGHLIHYRIRNSLPSYSYGGDARHFLDSEEEPGAALIEGFAHMIAMLTKGAMVNPTWELARDVNKTIWRGRWVDDGSDATYTGPTGCDHGTFETGEVVESAVSGTFLDMCAGGGAGLCFADVFKVFYQENVGSFSAFRARFVSNMGSGTPKTLAMYDLAQQHGIVFCRARFRNVGGSPFREYGPSGDTWNDGNRLIIDNYDFLRGTIRAMFEAGNTAVSTQVDIAQVGFAVLHASGDLLSAPPTSFAGWVDFDDDEITWDTYIAGFGNADCDLVLQARNEHGFTDTFDPKWSAAGAAAADGNPKTATEERALKVFGAWFDRDRDPDTPTAPPGEAVKEGMVITDNYAPYLVTESRKPQ